AERAHQRTHQDQNLGPLDRGDQQGWRAVRADQYDRQDLRRAAGPASRHRAWHQASQARRDQGGRAADQSLGLAAAQEAEADAGARPAQQGGAEEPGHEREEDQGTARGRGDLRWRPTEKPPSSPAPARTSVAPACSASPKTASTSRSTSRAIAPHATALPRRRRSSA